MCSLCITFVGGCPFVYLAGGAGEAGGGAVWCVRGLGVSKRSVALMSRIRSGLLGCFEDRSLGINSSVPGRVRLSSTLKMTHDILQRTLDHLGVVKVVRDHAHHKVVLARPFVLKKVGEIISPHVVDRRSLLSLLKFEITLRVKVDDSVFRGVGRRSVVRLRRVIGTNITLKGGRCTGLDRCAFRSGLCRVAKGGAVMRFRDVVRPIVGFMGAGLERQIRTVGVRLRGGKGVMARASLLGFVGGGSRVNCEGTVRRRFCICGGLVCSETILKRRGGNRSRWGCSG